MSEQLKRLGRVMASMVLVISGTALAFNSGSTGADGAFSPTVSTQVQLPENGIFNFTTVDIPSGVTVTFKRNTANTPIVILATGNVTIAGAIDVSGSSSTNVGAAGDGNLGDDGIPGRGGPGGQDGGRGGRAGAAATSRGGNGLGPGGGLAGLMGSSNCYSSNYPTGGGGAGFGAEGANSYAYSYENTTFSRGGVAYGSSQLLPLIGGSGGGGGSGYSGFGGSGGGGGGGAILIASSETLNVTGSILANGGASGATSGTGAGGTGGGGSGGAIRLLATTFSGNGTLSAAAGAASTTSGGESCFRGGNGAVGRIRLEAETFTRTNASTPPFPAVTAPTTVFVAGLPTLRITSVAGVSAPAVPTGNADIVLPATTPNPVTVTFATTGVPVGNTVTLTVIPAAAASVSAVSPALSGSTDSATTSVNIDLPGGPSVLQATTSYTVVAALGRELGTRYANGEQVERVTLIASLQGPPAVMLTTVSGKQYRVATLDRN
ncbi:hypothetical protein ACN28S_14860 [Cystobacter fuscus]